MAEALDSKAPGPLREVCALFLRLGATAFGGPAAHIALFEDELVARRRWLSREHFLDLLGATQLIPGPNSTEMALHLGHVRAGAPGLLGAGLCFILPAVAWSAALAWAYVRFGSLPEVGAFLYGAKPAILAVVLQALWRLGRTALTTPGLALVAAFGLAAAALGAGELTVLLASGVVLVAQRRAARGAALSGLLAAPALPLAGAGAAASLSLWVLFLFFLKVGAVLFGSGYVLLAFLRTDLVEHGRWLTDAQLLDAIAVGQLTPGPVFSTATFIGYVLGGVPGAAVATVGIFLPAFVYVALLTRLLPRLRNSPLAAAFLDGVNAASVALLAWALWQLGRGAIADPVAAALALASAVAVFATRLNSAWLVLAAGAIGLAAARLGLVAA